MANRSIKNLSGRVFDLKKLLIITLMLCLLTACGGGQERETLQDVYTPQKETPMQVNLTLPEDATMQTITGTEGKLYLCDNFTVTVQTLLGGDLSRTVIETTGYDLDRLTLIKTEKDGITCYRCSWAAAGEGGDQAAQTLILDDGSFHYAVTVMASEEKTGALTEVWQGILRSVSLSTAP